VQYEHRVTDRIAVYGGGQGTIDASSEYDNNDQLHVGTRIALSEHTRIETEVRDGHRGTGALAGIEHRLNEAHTLYGTMTHSTDTTEDPFDLANPSMLNTIGTNYAVGHRWQINDRARLFSEGQFSRGMEGSGLGHAFGLDYALPKGWNAGFTLQENELQTTLGSIDRSAYSVGIGHTGNRHRYASRVEYREDEGAGQSAVQWLTTNRVDFRLTESYRAAAKVNYARTRNRLTDDTDGKLIEGSVGIAYRPVNNNRLNWIGRYTYLYDLQSFGQENAETDRKLQVISWEAIYQFTRNFDLGLKLARRDGSVRFGRDAGPWFDATANFAAGSVRWHVMRNWDALLEYRWLQTEENDSERGGLLVSLDRHLTDNFRVGVGYSFVDFSDDLTNVDYDFKGWFLNAVGKY
jgi:opacity protein-like surface antigen